MRDNMILENIRKSQKLKLYKPNSIMVYKSLIRVKTKGDCCDSFIEHQYKNKRHYNIYRQHGKMTTKKIYDEIGMLLQNENQVFGPGKMSVHDFGTQGPPDVVLT